MPNSSFSQTLTERGFTRFVLLRPREAPCPTPLANALRERWSHVIQVNDPLGALAELCVMERAEQPRRAYGLPARERIAFIVLERSAWNDLSDLLRTIRSRLPEVSIWVHTGELILEVSTPTPQEGGGNEQRRAGDRDKGRRSGFGELKLAGSWSDAPLPDGESDSEGAENQAQDAHEPARTEPDLGESGFPPDPDEAPPRTVSPEELEMLLDHDDDDDEDEHTPPGTEQGLKP